MTGLSDMIINVAVGGCLDGRELDEGLKARVAGTFEEIRKYAREYNNHAYNFTGNDIKLRLFSNPFIMDAFWGELAEFKGFRFNLITPEAACGDETRSILEKAQSVVNINTCGSYFTGSGSVIPEWLADQADLAVLLWDGNENFNNREIWALMQACKRNNVPVIWIDVNSQENVYWTSESYFDKYEPDSLKVHIDRMFCKKGAAFEKPEESRIPLWNLWNSLYNRFLKKYKAKIQPLPYIKDKILDKDCKSNDIDQLRELNRIRIAAWFNKFDCNAIEYSQKYRTSIYLRSIMPFIVTVFISIGFYAETILGFIYKVPGTGISPWAVLASLGFLIHSVFNYYMFKLSENSNVSSWHLRFVDNRFIAEVLRLSAHFVPFGIPINYSSSLNRFGSKIFKKQHVSSELRRISRSIDMGSVTFDRYNADRLFENLTCMIDDQIAYHENSTKRYVAIVTKLKELTTFFFIVGLTIVLLRGGLQFILAYIKIDVTRNGINLITFIKSFANMLALVLPAWASYFSLKLSLGNFEGLMNNNMEMKNGLKVMRKILDNEKKRSDISFERIYSFSKDLSKMMLGEVADWYSQISSQRLTKL